MTVAFWGEVRHSGTTTHMQTIADFLAIMYADSAVVLDGNIHQKVCPGGAADFVQKNFIQVVDCGTGLSSRTRRILNRADLIIVSLRQEYACIRNFFENNPYMVQARMSKDMLFLLGGYECEPGIDASYLARVYRVEPESVSVIPYNNEYYYAIERGKGRAFIEREYQNGTIRNERFMRELRKITTQIVRRKNLWNRL